MHGASFMKKEELRDYVQEVIENLIPSHNWLQNRRGISWGTLRVCEPVRDDDGDHGSNGGIEHRLDWYKSDKSRTIQLTNYLLYIRSS